MNNLYWHFLPDDGCLRFGTKEKVKAKHTLILPPDTKLIPCEIGFHASKRALDALHYAPGSIICRVTLHGEKIPHGNPIDKYCAHGRTVLQMANAEEVLRIFARKCALSVIHLWEAPQVVIDYLNTGDEKLRAAAWAAARDAARDAARNAARDAARDATRNAAWAAAWYAARNAAWDAARNAAWDAAWDATRNAAWAAAWYAAWYAARAAARDAARNAAWDAAWGARNIIFEELLTTLLNNQEVHT
jgi:hypothetical protein